MTRGGWVAFLAYVLWGVLPVYWKHLGAVPAIEILCHRVVWSVVVTLGVVVLGGRWTRTARALADRRLLAALALSGSLLAINWFTYIWAIGARRLVEASLGYFINPLVSVLLGVLVLGERLRRWQVVAVAFAFVGVLHQAILYGRMPWVALVLALTFGFYGLVRKTVAAGAVDGLLVESAFLSLPAIGYLTWLHAHGHGALFAGAPVTDALLLGAGVVTTVPLACFAFGARRVRLVTLGLLQFAAPTLQLLIGVLLYGEPFPVTRLVGFLLIWMALALYSGERLVAARRRAER